MEQVKRTRLVFIDNVRILLIIVVVAFHAGAPYAGVFWYFVPRDMTPLSEFGLAWFMTASVSFFLGLFFFISGYFTPGSYDRKGAGPYFRDRFRRLGIPLVVFVLFIMPLFGYTLYLVNFGNASSSLSLWEYLTREYYWETHHLWFVETLLGFCVLYGVLQLFRGGRRTSLGGKTSRDERTSLNGRTLKVPGNLHILVFVLSLAVITFVIRVRYPVGRWDPWKLIEPAHLPQYISMFAAGVVAYRYNWVLRLPSSVGYTWLYTGLVTVFLFPVLSVVGEGKFAPFIGGFHWKPLIFAVWETFVCVGLSIGLITFFRDKVTTHKKIWRILSANVYGVYLIHVPVVVSVQYAMITVEIDPMVKFVLVTFSGVIVSFLVSCVVRKIPGFDRIL